MTVEERIQHVITYKLPQLDLSDCGLTEIPEQVFELEHLRTLILGRNYAPNDDKSNKNSIPYIPSEITKLNQLEGLGLANNELNEFPLFLTQLTRLQTLMINHTNIGVIPKEIFQLSRLKVLSLGSNNIHEVPNEIGHLKHLQVLGLTNNHISTIPDNFSKLQYLQQLGLSNNQLSIIPPSILKIKQLRVLGLANNYIKTLPDEIQNWRYLQKLDISGNPLPSNLIHVAAKGSKGIQQYFNEKENHKKRRLQYIIKGKKEAKERVNLREKVLGLLKTNKLVCEVCNGKKELKGYNIHLKMHFDFETCYGCSGKGIPESSTTDLHEIVESCHKYKEKYRDLLIVAVKEEQGFRNKLGIKASNMNVLYESTRENLTTILKEKQKRVDALIERFSIYEAFERKIHITLYNHHLLKITDKEEQKGNEFQFETIDKFGELYSIARMAEVIIGEIEALFDGLDTAFGEKEEKDMRIRLAELIQEFEVLGLENDN